MQILTDFMLAPPFGAVAGVLLGLSLALMSDAAGISVFRRRDGLSRALYFFSGLLLVSWILLLLSVAGLVTSAALQIIGIGICLGGAAVFIRRRKTFLPSVAHLARQPGRTWMVLMSVVLLLIALSPPTDADSLDYHLGVPLHVLRTGGLDFDLNQLHFQMFGFGEMLNLFGLANGAASFGAFVQLLALGWLFAAFREMLPASANPVALMLVFGIPALVALVPGCKHLLTGACCTAVCFLFFFRNGKTSTVKSLILPLLGLAFAAGLKYSFLFSVLLLLAYGLSRERRLAPKALIAAVSVLLLACGPLLLFKLYRFQDPLAPFLTGAFGTDPVVSWFCDFIRSYKESLFPFPVNILLPYYFGAISAVLGWGLAILVAYGIAAFRSQRAEVFLIAALCVLTMVLGQNTARFFIEPYLMALPFWLIWSSARKWGQAVNRIGQLQFLVTLPMSLYLAWTLGKGVFSPGLQESVMRRNASFYAPAAWVNAIVPVNATLLTDIRSRSLLRMPVVPIEYHYARNAGPAEVRRLDSLLRSKYRVAYIAVINPDSQFVRKYCGELVAGPRIFLNATRNPFNRGTYSMVIYNKAGGSAQASE